MNNIIFIFRYLLFWILFFFVNRLFFIVFFLDDVNDSSLRDILNIIPHSFLLDISFISYLLVIIICLIWIQSFFRSSSFLNRAIFYYTIFFTSISLKALMAEVIGFVT